MLKQQKKHLIRGTACRQQLTSHRLGPGNMRETNKVHAYDHPEEVIIAMAMGCYIAQPAIHTEQ